ncbi:MAG TPA: CPBP family intramembrane glutamic endopeptidase [Chloroflexota bacterium]|nr:CPBP family intramembrane glutamic endopeptidase [Chloroflexota bacterium]
MSAPYTAPAKRTTGARSRALWSPLALIAALLAYGNGSAWLATRRSTEVPLRFNWAHVAMLSVVIAWAGLGRFSARELGLAPARIRRSLLSGLALAAVPGLVIRPVLSLPVIARRLAVPEIDRLSRAQIARLLLGQYLIGSALFEEVAFRGLLQAMLARTFDPGRTVLLTSGAFALWHTLIVWHNVARLRAPSVLRPFLTAAALCALFTFGALLGWLRHRTDHLAGAVVAHWLAIVAIVLFIRRRGQPFNASP